MGKVWLKTKYDNGMKMESPHSINMAAAMYGFHEMGAEIIPYHLIDDIYDDVDGLLEEIDGFMTENGYTPSDYSELNDVGRYAERVYDRIYNNN